MMPYQIWKFVIPNAKYQRKRFTFKCRNFVIEIDLFRLHKYSYIFLFKVYRKWELVVRRHVGIRANPVGFERCCYSKNLFSPCNLHTHPQRE